MMKWWADASYIPIRILWKATHLGRIKDICFTVIAQEVDLLSDLMCTFSFFFFFKETISFLKVNLLSFSLSAIANFPYEASHYHKLQLISLRES